MDFPAGVKSYVEHDSDQAGRFQGSSTPFSTGCRPRPARACGAP